MLRDAVDRGVVRIDTADARARPDRLGRLRGDLAGLEELAVRVEDRAVGELLLRVVGVVVALDRQHVVDRRGRCQWCRPARRWRWWCRSCQVQATLADYRLYEPGPSPGVDDATDAFESSTVSSSGSGAVRAVRLDPTVRPIGR